MAVNLTKGGRVNLEKEAPGLARVFVGLGWDRRVTDGTDFDLDASVFLLGSDGKARSEEDFVFYNHAQALGGVVKHLGDNLTGAGEGDDEVVEIDLNALVSTDAAVQKLAFVVTIHEAEARNQNFGQVENAFIRVVNQADNTEIVRFDLTEDYSVETAMIFGELYIKDNQWRFAAVGSGFAGGLGAACAKYGL
uniref:Tellurium resistance protein TerD n=1 Tax=Candidatus Kentrum sp. MB TaxID=2138164 RepID=A0A451BFA4_9GAMM|nr:MAG: tellurium resistance protein TerD [Candidatus Kentron sp. MB]VFK34785.1 MAG: tellurium resistance protein TerD [Candidatus Kentron sp. MB]VFK76947.1 MAG: tellurium resistance protein TerD [Candidatus Kentron sp. MB]